MKSKRPRVVCYWNTSEVKEEKFKCNMNSRIKKLKQTTKSNKQNKK